MCSMENNYFTLEWIPFKRFVLRLVVDEKKTIFLARFRQKRSAEKMFKKLKAYKGYRPEIVDTKAVN